MTNATSAPARCRGDQHSTSRHYLDRDQIVNVFKIPYDGVRWYIKAYGASPDSRATSPMTDLNRRSLAYLSAALAIPIVLFALLFGWAEIENVFASREVSRFIREHETLVAERLNNPSVHSFRLSHDPRDRGTLLIQFDVDDKKTFDLLEADLDGIWSMRNPPMWDFTVLSKEDLGNNYGYAAWGIGLMSDFVVQFGIAAVLTFVIIAIGLWTSLRRIDRRSMQA